jgi:hypothetical protein
MCTAGGGRVEALRCEIEGSVRCAPKLGISRHLEDHRTQCEPPSAMVNILPANAPLKEKNAGFKPDSPNGNSVGTD